MAPKPVLSDSTYTDEAAEDEYAPTPIGVPRDYVVQRGTMPTGRSGGGWGSGGGMRWSQDDRPMYWSGDQWTTVRTLRPEDRAQLQLVLKQLGLIPPGSRVVLGSWDDASAGGFKEVLAWANVNGTTWQQALEQMLTSRDQFGGDEMAQGDPLPAFVAEVANPDDIKRAFREGLKARIGRGAIDEGRIEQAVRAFQQQQVSAQRAQYDATYDTSTGSVGPGGTVTAPPSIETFVDTEAKRTDPVAYDAYKALDVFSTVLETLGGSGA